MLVEIGINNLIRFLMQEIKRVIKPGKKIVEKQALKERVFKIIKHISFIYGKAATQLVLRIEKEAKILDFFNLKIDNNLFDLLMLHHCDEKTLKQCDKMRELRATVSSLI